MICLIRKAVLTVGRLKNLIPVFLIVAAVLSVNVSAAVTDTYIYDKNGDTEPAPEPASAVQSIRGGDLGIGAFSEPQDLCFSNSGVLYIADTGNNRIVVIKNVGMSSQCTEIIDSFLNGGTTDTFNSPAGVFADSDGNLFISDTENARIVKLSESGELLQIICAPEDKALQSDFAFKPTKLAVDKYRQLYVISSGYNAGLMEFEPGGTYTQSMGAPQVTKSILDQLWQRFQTKAQRERTQSYVPTEYSNVTIDEDGFLFVTTSAYDDSAGDSAPKPLRKLNAKGLDVLNRVGDPVGDEIKNGETYKGYSVFSDVCMLGYGDFALLDHNRGRVFAYNSVGELLYEFGGPGDVSGAIRNGTAIGFYNDRFYILDTAKTQVTVFELTEYGKLFGGVAKARQEIDFETEKSLWDQILSRNANCTLAMRGLGNAAYKAKDMKLAMKYYKLAGDRDDYSKAYAFVRRNRIENNVWIIVPCIAVIAAVSVVCVRSKKRVSAFVSRRPTLRAVMYAGHCCTHPMDGFWDLKREKRGTVLSATILLLICMAVNAISSLGTGFIFNKTELESYSIFSVLYIALAVALWTICLWCVTTLMNGEGTFKDIYIATCYATLPYSIINVIAVLLSRVLLSVEGDFYYVLVSFSMIWLAFLLVCSVKQVHDFFAGKTVAAILIVIIVILLIIFISMLVLALSQQFFDFIGDLISEIALTV